MSEIPRVLLLGDSIRMSYQPLVAEILAGKAEVVGPADNCQYSLFTLSSLVRWIGALGEQPKCRRVDSSTPGISASRYSESATNPHT